MKVFIKASDCISAQPSFESDLPQKLESYHDDFYSCIKPEYKQYISPKLLRRMSPIIRNGVTCSMSVLKQANIEQPDAIIVGTALGCIRDTHSFLSQLINDKEQLPNPTHFIQSTHNTIAGQIALLLSCKAYNFTFSQNHNSFETALLDAKLLLLDKKAKNVLLGGVDEMNEQSYDLIKGLPCYKHTKPGEGAAFFLLSDTATKVEFEAIQIINSNVFDWHKELDAMGLSHNDIDVVIGGDNYKNDKAYAAFSSVFNDKPYLWYKPFVGEFGTASAIAFWLGTKVIEEQNIPSVWSKNGTTTKQINKLLIYNCVGNEHSIMVLSKHM